MIFSIHVSGLGGQGVLTLTGLFAEYTRSEGLPTTLFNSKGMAQRGGRVTSDIRFIADEAGSTGKAAAGADAGDSTNFGPRIGDKNADILVGLEIGEALNSLPLSKPGGIVLLYSHRSVPANIVPDKHGRYPNIGEVGDYFSAAGARVFTVPESDTSANIYILGVLAAVLPAAGTSFRGDPMELQSLLRTRLKRGIETNLEALNKGYEYGQELADRS